MLVDPKVRRSIRFDADTWAAVEKRAQAEERTPSDVVRRLVREGLNPRDVGLARPADQ